MSDRPPAEPVLLRVSGGGTPTPEQLAALMVALAPADGGPGPRMPAWTAAALREGVGGPIVLAPSDLRVLDPGA